ncbi:MAG: GxxExxY protein [Bacteroidia bacterium]|nr:GxxExxY protein [Bacteroidia bacterium]
MEIDKISEKVIGCAMKVHSLLGPGLLESVYEACLTHELVLAGLRVERQKPIPVIYDEVKLDAGFRIDLLVEDRLVVELKSVDSLHPIYMAQLITYLKLSKREVGLLINFNVKWLKDGVKRVVNDI